MTLATTVRGSYRPRRQRSGTPPAFQITPRDLDILRAVARYRFLNSDHIRRLIPGSTKNLTNRLKGLFELGHLDRPECQYDFYRPGGGSGLAVYALGDAGARLLADVDDRAQGARVSWAQKNKEVGRPFLEHTLAIADFAIALRADVRRSNRLDCLDGPELVARLPEATRNRAKPFRLTVPVIFRGTRLTIGVEPDYAVSLGDRERGRRASFLIEIDRGTMPVMRSDLAQSSMMRKFLAYGALWRAKAHTSELGWRNFRVLVVTSNTERTTNMRDCLRELTGGKGSPLFWFADKHDLLQGSVLSAPWIDGEGNMRRLDGSA